MPSEDSWLSFLLTVSRVSPMADAISSLERGNVISEVSLSVSELFSANPWRNAANRASASFKVRVLDQRFQAADPIVCIGQHLKTNIKRCGESTYQNLTFGWCKDGYLPALLWRRCMCRLLRGSGHR